MFDKNNDIFKILFEMENGDRSVVVSEKAGRIVIAQKTKAYDENKNPIDIFLKYPLSLSKDKVKDLVCNLIKVI